MRFVQSLSVVLFAASLVALLASMLAPALTDATRYDIALAACVACVAALLMRQFVRLVLTSAP